jgi:methionine-rich copper-binding protein CopC
VSALRSNRLIAALAAAAVTSGVAAAAALAHTELKSTYPAKGKSASVRIGSVSATFSATIRGGSIKVTGPGGSTASSGAGGRDPRNVKRLKVPLKSGLKAGSYTAKWTMKAADGHTQTGTFSFKLK